MRTSDGNRGGMYGDACTVAGSDAAGAVVAAGVLLATATLGAVVDVAVAGATVAGTTASSVPPRCSVFWDSVATGGRGFVALYSSTAPAPPVVQHAPMCVCELGYTALRALPLDGCYCDLQQSQFRCTAQEGTRKYARRHASTHSDYSNLQPTRRNWDTGTIRARCATAPLP